MLEHFTDYPHSLSALTYAYDIVNGHRLSCKEVKQACQRFIDDLQGLDGYFYDVEKAEKACKRIELLPLTKGRWGAQRKLFKLELWQKFIICNLFGWVNESGFRRFRKAYLKIARKNGKSPLSAAIGHLMFAMDNECGAEVYCGATTEKQAWEVFRPAKQMAERTPDYLEKFGIEVNAKSMIVLDNESRFEPLIGKPGDGSSPSCAIADEYHEHESDDFVEAMETGMVGREQPLLLMITTAGNNTGGPCYDMETECTKLLDKVYDDERIFCLIYGIDEDDDWTSPDILEKANPNLGVSVELETLLASQKEAVRNALKQNSFQRKHLNKWVGAHTSWMNMQSFNQCKNETIDINDYIDHPCYIGVDLASTIDIAAIIKLFIEERNGKPFYTAFLDSYLPEERVLSAGYSRYEKWHNEGHLIATDGNEIDMNEIEKTILDCNDKYNVVDIAFDPAYSTQMRQNIINGGGNVVGFLQRTMTFTAPMKELESAIVAGRFQHDGNPILSWMMSNVIAKEDANENVFPRKQKRENKIDGVVALIMAIGRSMVHDESDRNSYEERGFLTLG